MTSASSQSPWLRTPAWDLCLLAFCWVPFYLWVVFGLGLGGEAFGAEPLGPRQSRDALVLAIAVALGFTYVHRHYTFLLVYGDKKAFGERARSYVLAPVFIVACVALARSADGVVLLKAGPTSVTPWILLMLTSGLWNVWHTVQQRYGICRVYAAKAKGGLELRAHANRDRMLLWSAIVLVAITLLLFRGETFAGISNARSVYAALSPLVASTSSRIVLGLMSAAIFGLFAWWLRHELAAPLTLRQRLPRWSFLLSTLALLGVFVVHGPIVGYLCFGAAHALEYLSFVHHFGRGKFERDPENKSLAATTLRKPLVWAPVLITGLGLAYLFLRDYRNTEVYLTYYVATSMLHFLYDGWIWKVRNPEVARPLGVGA